MVTVEVVYTEDTAKYSVVHNSGDVARSITLDEDSKYCAFEFGYDGLLDGEYLIRADEKCQVAHQNEFHIMVDSETEHREELLETYLFVVAQPDFDIPSWNALRKEMTEDNFFVKE